jgi:branched-chain amino acid transport system permease protein
MGFAAVGAVAGAVAMIDWHWDLSLALLFAGTAGAVVAFVVGVPTLRLDGVFVAVTTLAFGLAASGYFLDRGILVDPGQSPHGVPYLRGGPRLQTAVFATCLGILGTWWWSSLRGLRHSRTGRVLRALPPPTSGRWPATGATSYRAKLTAFAVSGFIAGPGRMPVGGGQPAVRRVLVHRCR